MTAQRSIKHRRFALSCSALLVAGLALAGCGSSDSGGSTSTLERLKDAKAAKIGLVNAPPYSGLEPNGETTGYTPDLAKLILGDIGVTDVSAVSAQYGDMVPGLQAKRWDVVSAALIVTPERCNEVIFSDAILGGPASFASVGEDAPASVAEAAKTKTKIGVLKGSEYIEAIKELGVEQGQLTTFDDVRAAIDAMLAKRVDVVLTNSVSFDIPGLDESVKISSTIPDIVDKPSAFAFRKSDTDLRDAFNKKLVAMKDDGSLDELLAKWKLPPIDPNGVSSKEACAAPSE